MFDVDTYFPGIDWDQYHILPGLEPAEYGATPSSTQVPALLAELTTYFSEHPGETEITAEHTAGGVTYVCVLTREQASDGFEFSGTPVSFEELGDMFTFTPRLTVKSTEASGLFICKKE